MTVNMRNAAEQAAFDLGRAMAKYEMATIGTLQTAAAEIAGNIISGSVARKRPGRAAKGSVAATKALEAQTAATKSRKISRGARIAKGPRTKGVKEAITNLIASDPMTVAQIIERTGYKENSIRATLMGLKKAGLATLDENKLWYGSAAQSQGRSGNSDHERARAEY